jgi:Protein of unknown function (DUF1499).
MPYRPERPVSISAIWARRLGRFALALGIAALIFHRLGLLALPNAVAVILLSAALAILVVGLSAIGFAMLWLIGAKGGRASFFGFVMAALVLGPVGYAASRYFTLPKIHDVSTDLVDAPEWLQPPQVTPSWLPRAVQITPAMRGAQAEAYPNLTGRRYDGAIDRVLDAVAAVAADRKWKLVADDGADFLVPDASPSPAEQTEDGFVDPDNVPVPEARPDFENEPAVVTQPVVVLQYTWKSLVFGIPYDIVVRLVEEEETTFVDMRSATREGDHDLGLNAALVRGFLRDLDVALLGIAGG